MNKPTKHYSRDAIARSLRHFLFGKSFSLVASIVVLFVVARVLDPGEYAVYVSLQALVGIVGIVATLGEKRVLYRFLPEFRSIGNNIAAYRLLFIGVSTNLFCLIFVIWMTIDLLLNKTAQTLNLSDWVWLVPWYLLIGGTRLFNVFVSAVFENFLWQNVSQYSLATGAMFKMILILLLASDLNIVLLLIVEGVSELIVLLMLGYGFIRRVQQDSGRQEGSKNWWSVNRRRLLKMQFWGFLENYSRVLYGSAPNRMVAASYLAVPEVALFGFADNLLRLARRVMPARLFIGMIRPVAIARFSESKEFSQVAWIASFAYRCNLALVALGIALVVSVGEPFFALVTDNKYSNAAWLVAGMLAVLGTEGMRAVVELMAQAVERNRLDVFGNVIQSLSIFLAIPFLEDFSYWAFVVANLVGTVCANLFVLSSLRRDGFVFHLRIHLVLLIIGYGLICGAFGWVLVNKAGVNFIPAGLAVILIYAVLIGLKPPFQPSEVSVFLDIAKMRQN